jgi:hypothetical protein
LKLKESVEREREIERQRFIRIPASSRRDTSERARELLLVVVVGAPARSRTRTVEEQRFVKREPKKIGVVLLIVVDFAIISE